MGPPPARMTTDAHLPAKSVPLTTETQEKMPDTNKRFIGAVEDEWELFSDRAEDYTVGAPIGFGASSIVYAATYHPSGTISSSPNHASSKGIPCALKVLDLDSLPPRSLQLLQRETTLMSLSKHPNVLRVRGSWMDGHKLYIALRLMNKGSAADVMRYGWPGGMEEDVVRCILRQALKGLNYLHINGFIHRDIKAANLLIDDDGTVLLGDLGVAADLSEDTSHAHSSTPHSKFSITSTALLSQSRSAPSVHSGSSNGKRPLVFDGGTAMVAQPIIRKRKSFVGTPCWMAPELIQGKQYDSSADIWSFGITALELSQGRPPRSRESPQRVLLKTIQDAPPTLDREGGAFKYSRAFKEMVDSCLNKDPSKRPSAEELLQTPFFKSSKKKSYLINTILKGLPPLVQRQERRAILPAVKSASSIDSWDFAMSITSPTATISRRRVLEDLVAAEDEANNSVPEVFHMEDEFPLHSNSTHHSRNLSWAEDVVEEIEVEIEDGVVPASPSTSVSSIPDDGQSSSLMSNSTPSSFTDASEAACTKAQSTTPPSPTQQPLSPIEEHSSHPTVTVRKSALGLSSSVSPGSSSSPSISASPGTKSQTGLWKKFKSNVRRGSSSDGGDEGSPKKQGTLTGVFSTASRGLLSRNSTGRSLSSTTFNESK